MSQLHFGWIQLQLDIVLIKLNSLNMIGRACIIIIARESYSSLWTLIPFALLLQHQNLRWKSSRVANCYPRHETIPKLIQGPRLYVVLEVPNRTPEQFGRMLVLDLWRRFLECFSAHSKYCFKVRVSTRCKVTLYTGDSWPPRHPLSLSRATLGTGQLDPRFCPLK